MTGEKYVQTRLSLQDSYTYSHMNNIPSHCRGWQGAKRKSEIRETGLSRRWCADCLACRAGSAKELGWGYSCACEIKIWPLFKSDFLEQDFLV